MEKMDNIKIFGTASSERKDAFLKDAHDYTEAHIPRLSPEQFELLKQYESKKTPAERAMIDFANAYTNKLMESLGIHSYDLSPENIHILSVGGMLALFGHTSNGYAEGIDKSVFIDREVFASKTQEALTILHEMVHVKGATTYAVDRDDNDPGNIFIALHRNGAMTRKSEHHTEIEGEDPPYFQGLLEAIVEDTCKQARAELMMMPELSEESEFTRSKDYIEFLAEMEENIPDFERDDIVWLSKGEREHTIISHSHTYHMPRKMLSFLKETITAKFPEEVALYGGINKYFHDMHFRGAYLPLARMIENIFGKGSFRELAQMTSEPESAEQYLALFKTKLENKTQA